MTEISQTITLLPAGPDPEDPENFAADGYAFLSALEDTPGEMNAFATQANSLRAEVNANAISAAASAVVAIAAANFKGPYSGLTGSLARPASVEHNSMLYLLLADLADVTSKEPGAAGSESTWLPFILTPMTVNKTAGATLTTDELTGKTITNDGAASEIELQWPTMADDQECTIYINDAQYIKLIAPIGVTFRIGQQQSASGGYIRSNTVGSRCRVAAMPDELVVFEYDGVWTYDE